MNLRPAAVPLVTVDPFFSIWSGADAFYGDCTRHWSGKPCPLLVGLYVDNSFCPLNVVNLDFSLIKRRTAQTDLKVTPLSTTYEFENEFAKITLTFTTPLLLDRLDILTRPVSYVAYNVERKCDETKKLRFVFGVNARCCVDNKDQEVSFKKTPYSVACGNTVQNPLSQSGDNVMIDWGYIHLCDKNAYIVSCEGLSTLKIIPFNKTYNAYHDMPYMIVRKEELSGVIAIAYDEIYPIEYFGKPLKEYYTKYFDNFGDMVNAAISEYDEIKKLCDKFDDELLKEAEKFGENYKNIISLAYRQAIAAHKLVEDENGDILFLSKECDSNGCIGTLDVTYPSIPLFLKYNPELVKGMLRPILKFAKSDEWEFEFTPHDVGRYPLANGQVYGKNRFDKPYEAFQMPVEEAGNMLLCLAAIYKYANDKTIFDAEKEILKKWADYLVKYGYDPGEQLCTDDFAGHLNHNCNLSLKAILGIASYAMLSGDNSYMDIAKEYAAKWEIDAKADHGATRLTFDVKDGWSLKYNIVWDTLLGFNIFTDELKKKETEFYLTKLNRYGVPLDSRKDYTKIDWLMWSTKIYDNKEYFEKVCQSIINMINETYDRVPLTDWYYTTNASYVNFKNRTVVGGLFINMI